MKRNKFSKFGKSLSRNKMSGVKGGGNGIGNPNGNQHAYGHCGQTPNPNAADTPGWQLGLCPDDAAPQFQNAHSDKNDF